MTQAADWTFLLAPLAVGLTMIALCVLLGRLAAAAPIGRGRSKAQPAVRPSP